MPTCTHTCTSGCTLLHIAVQHNHIEMAKKLLTHYKEVDEDNPFLNKEIGEMSTEVCVDEQ